MKVKEGEREGERDRQREGVYGCIAYSQQSDRGRECTGALPTVNRATEGGSVRVHCLQSTEQQREGVYGCIAYSQQSDRGRECTGALPYSQLVRYISKWIHTLIGS